MSIRGILFALIVPLISFHSVAGEELLSAFGFMRGRNWETRVTTSNLVNVPKRDVARGPVPLSIEDAMTETLSLLHGVLESSQPPKWRVVKVTFQELNSEWTSSGRDWVYVVEAKPTFVQGPPTVMRVVVLLNGKTVEPRETKMDVDVSPTRPNTSTPNR